MPDLFNNVTFAKYTPTYVQAPLEQFAKSAEVLNQRYEQNKDLKDQLDIAMSNIKVEDADNPIVKTQLESIRKRFDDVLAKGDYENAGSIVKQAYKDFASNKALNAATENFTARQTVKNNLRSLYQQKDLSYNQYQDRVKRFNAYSGIGDPDDLGFYTPYEFDYGAKAVDLNALAKTLSEGFKPDITSRTSQSVNYNADPELRAIGVADSITTATSAYADGRNIGTVIDLGLKNSPDAMAYINDEVRIHNENNPDSPITTQEFIDNFTKSYVENETYSTRESSTAVTRDLDNLKTQSWKKSVKNQSQQEGYSGATPHLYDEDTYSNDGLNKIRSFAEEQLNRLRNPKTGGSFSTHTYNTGFTNIKTRPVVLTPDQSQQFMNIAKLVGGSTVEEKTQRVIDYIKSWQMNAKRDGQYAEYNNDLIRERSYKISSAPDTRSWFSIEKNRELTSDEINALDMKKLAVVGTPTADNPFYDFTDKPTLAVGEVAFVDGKKYIVGRTTNELPAYAGTLNVNRMTRARRIVGEKVKIDNKSTVQYIPAMASNGNRAGWLFTDMNKNKSIFVDSYNEEGYLADDATIYNTFANWSNKLNKQ